MPSTARFEPKLVTPADVVSSLRGGGPIVANGVLISGVAGGESTTRGFLDGWDPDTGKKLWRRYTIPAPGEPGSETWEKDDDWAHGGASVWITGRIVPSAL